MSLDLARTFPLENWLTAEIFVPFFKGPVTKARAEFSGSTEAEMEKSWNRIKRFLSTYPELSGKPMPTYQSAFEWIDGREVWIVDSQKKFAGEFRPDYLSALRRFVRADQAKLIAFLRTFHPLQESALLKVIALIFLHELRDKNPEGALLASSLFDSVGADRGALAEIGFRERAAKRLGGKKAAHARKTDRAENEKKAIEIAIHLRAQGHAEHELSGMIAKKLQVSQRTAKRYLNGEKQKSGQ